MQESNKDAPECRYPVYCPYCPNIFLIYISRAFIFALVACNHSKNNPLEIFHSVVSLIIWKYRYAQQHNLPVYALIFLIFLQNKAFIDGTNDIIASSILGVEAWNLVGLCGKSPRTCIANQSLHNLMHWWVDGHFRSWVTYSLILTVQFSIFLAKHLKFSPKILTYLIL